MFRKFLFVILAIVSVTTIYLYRYNISYLLSSYGLLSLHPNLVRETALILDLGPQGIELTQLEKKDRVTAVATQFLSRTFFDIDNDGFAELTSWTNGKDGILVHDLNGNGLIDNQSELFGMDAHNINGFKKLARFDDNKDKFISKDDKIFNQLRVWVDSNSDGKSNKDELKSLGSMHIEKIGLKYTSSQSTVNAGNKVNHSAYYQAFGANIPIQDIELKRSNVMTRYLGNVKLDISTLFLPTLKGFGNLTDLHVAMSKDKVLLEQLRELSNSLFMNTAERLKDPEKLRAEFDALFFRWAECDQLPRNARGPFVDAQKLVFMEKMVGSRFGQEMRYPYSDPQNKEQGDLTTRSFNMASRQQMSFLMQQILGEKLYIAGKRPSYNLITGDISKGHLSPEAIINLEGLANSLTPEKRKYFWITMINILAPFKPQKAFEADEVALLNQSIAKTLPSESLQSIIIAADIN